MSTPYSKTVWQGAWHYTYYVSSRKRWYAHLSSPAEVEYCESGFGSTKKRYTRHYYTYSQIAEAIEAYNSRPRTTDVDIMAEYGPDPGYAPFPGREAIGAPNERQDLEQRVRRTFRRTQETRFRARTKRKDGAVCYFVEPDEPAARYLRVAGARRKSFSAEEIEAILPKVREDEAEALELHVAEEMVKFDRAWESGTHPCLIEAAKELNRLETAERRERLERERRDNLFWHVLLEDDLDEPQNEHVPHSAEGTPGWLTHIDHRDGCTYSRPDHDTSVFDPDDGHRLLRGHLALSLRVEREREVLHRVFAALGEPEKISNSGRAWWLGSAQELAARVNLRPTVWEQIDETACV